MVLNSDLIEQIETTPDTVISMTTGQKIMVLESTEEIVERVRLFRRSISSALISAGLFQWPIRNPRKPLVRVPISAPSAASFWLWGNFGRPDPGRGKVSDVKQISAAIVIFGGTLGAVMVSTPIEVLLNAARRIGSVFFEKTQPVARDHRDIVGLATQARKQGIVSLEEKAAKIDDPFLRKPSIWRWTAWK